MAIKMMAALSQTSEPTVQAVDTALVQPARTVVTSEWRRMLPVLHGAGFVLRELRKSDAASLFSLLTTEEVARFITPPPTSVEGFEKFIEYAQRRRAEGQFVCFAVVPQGLDTAVGIFQLRALDSDFSVAEWGFAMGSAFWGSGLFANGAALTLAFAFEQIGSHRLEARAMVANGRGNAALQKMGAVKEGRLRESIAKNGSLHDEHLWAIVETDWRQANGVWRPSSDAPAFRRPRLAEGLDNWEGIVGVSDRVH